MAYFLIANVGAISSDGGNSVTTLGIDTTGADLIVAVVGRFDDDPSPGINVTDNKGNTFIELTRYGTLGAPGIVRIFYVQNPNVGSGHTFSTLFNFPSICIAAFSGSTSTPFDVENGQEVSSTTNIQSGSITPSINNELVIAGLCTTSTEGSTVTIDSGFTITNNENYTGGQSEGSHLAYLIQTSALAVNPKWSWSNNIDAIASIASFKAASIGVTNPSRLSLLGIG